MVIWANTHLTSILGIGAAAFWLYNGKHSLRIVATAVGVMFVATLFTPYGGAEWLTFLEKTSHPFQHQAIAEFKPATIMQYPTGFLIFLALFLALCVVRAEGRMPVARIFLSGVFTLGSLAVVKFMPFALIYIGAVISTFWASEGSEKLGKLGEGIERFRKLIHRIPREGLSFVLICLFIVNVFRVWQLPVQDQIVPVKALDFIIEKKLPHPLLNDFGRGGYVMYRLSDSAGNLEHKVPIDGRTNVTTHDVWDKFFASFKGKANWKEYIDLVKPETILWPTGSALTSLLLNDQEWCRIFTSGDDTIGFSVFIKHQELLDRAAEFESECASTVIETNVISPTKNPTVALPMGNDSPSEVN